MWVGGCRQEISAACTFSSLWRLSELEGPEVRVHSIGVVYDKVDGILSREWRYGSRTIDETISFSAGGAATTKAFSFRSLPPILQAQYTCPSTINRHLTQEYNTLTTYSSLGQYV